ncbi:MAG: ATP-dependent helicase [Thermoguttaceae bacterium]
MSGCDALDEILSELNPQQRLAVRHGEGPLLVVAGAGTGKTATLVHRVAWLIAQGIDPGRILLLTFTRRAAGEMLRRVDSLLRRLHQARPATRGFAPAGSRVWGGTFHAVATRLLRHYARAIGLPPEFTIHDRTDSEDFLNVLRTELGLAKADRRFPQKGTCLDIYSRCVNAQEKLEQVLAVHFPWCKEWGEGLARLFDAYVDRKQATSVLDYDDLLVYWHTLLCDPQAGPLVRKRFDCVLVDEYQDTNALQAEILYQLSPEGKGLTVVGDDAQSIYSFRAATVRNILDFPKHYAGTTIVTLEQNYRSTQPILDATNQVIALARERYTKDLWSERRHGDLPALVTCQSEDDQADYVIRQILEHREVGIQLRRQAVLFRASHHSILLEAELTRRGIPFHKYGGLRFIETAHVKDLMAFLRLAENPRDLVAGVRVLGLLPGIGPRKARHLMDLLAASGGSFTAWKAFKPPPATTEIWPKFVALLAGLAQASDDLPSQVHRVRMFYAPMLVELYDNPHPRARDLEQLEQIASRYKSRAAMLAEIALDPPSSTQDLAGRPLLDDDYLVLSTIHSAKGLEWDAVYVIHASDGNIPSDLATGSPEQIEEERRLFYVALTRAKRWLYVLWPLRYYHSRGFADQYGLAQLTRFLPERAARCFRRLSSLEPTQVGAPEQRPGLEGRQIGPAVRKRTKQFWS